MKIPLLIFLIQITYTSTGQMESMISKSYKVSVGQRDRLSLLIKKDYNRSGHETKHRQKAYLEGRRKSKHVMKTKYGSTGKISTVELFQKMDVSKSTTKSLSLYSYSKNTKEVTWAKGFKSITRCDDQGNEIQVDGYRLGELNEVTKQQFDLKNRLIKKNFRSLRDSTENMTEVWVYNDSLNQKTYFEFKMINGQMTQTNEILHSLNKFNKTFRMEHIKDKTVTIIHYNNRNDPDSWQTFDSNGILISSTYIRNRYWK